MYHMNLWINMYHLVSESDQFSIHVQIQAEGVTLQADYRGALQAALIVSAKRFSSGPPQVSNMYRYLYICISITIYILLNNH